MLNRDWPRISDDIDFFHDTDEEIVAAARKDIKSLENAGFSVHTDIEIYGVVEATVSELGTSTTLQWMSDQRCNMNDIAIEILRDTLNRSAKIDVDNGSAPDFATAVERLGRHHVSVVVGPEIAVSAAHQAALLTTVNIARRFALGGVSVSGPTGGPLLVLQPGERSLEADIVRLGGRLGLPQSVPRRRRRRSSG